jgi:hypothetical protein
MGQVKIDIYIYIYNLILMIWHDLNPTCDIMDDNFWHDPTNLTWTQYKLYKVIVERFDQFH